MEDDIERLKTKLKLRSPKKAGSTLHIPKDVVVIGKYKLGERLGKGAFSIVYKGLNVENGNFVAIKRMKRKKDVEEGFMREIEILKPLKHQHIVQYIDLIVTDHHLNLVLEYVESGSLAQVIERFGVFPEPLVGLYMEQVLKGLDYLHCHNIAHRDIKGPNLLITKEGTVKLADFGIALTSKLNDSKFQGSVVDGSPFWMAPEIIQLSSVSTSCDIWSLACTIIELLTGYPPYYDNAALTALYRMVEDDHPPLPEELSEDLIDFLLRCFQKQPEKRPTASKLLSHGWIQKAAKFGKKEEWKNTVERVKKYNTKKKRDTLDNLSLQSIQWDQQEKQMEWSTVQPRHITEEYDSEGNQSPKMSRTKSTLKIGHRGPIPIDSTDDLMSKINESTNDFPPKDITYFVLIVGTETKRNLLFSYTVYKIKVGITYPAHSAKIWYILRSYSDFCELDRKIRNSFQGLPQNLPDLPRLKFFGNTEPQYVEYFLAKLMEYLENLIKIPEIRVSRDLAMFLKSDK